jgi:hypothetical protein
MIPIHVALVRYYKGENVDRSYFLRVAAALQVQLTRDFTPIWDIPAVVSAFESLDDVPPAAIPLFILKPGTLDPRFHGFHVTESDQPMGLVEAREGWSLAASHELLEIVIDPQGELKVPGESIADSATRGQLAPGAAKYLGQGQVSYLLEVCDPCQAADNAYTVNGITVSDFVTPRYYAPAEGGAGGYSFTGKVTKPLQVLAGGYISWYTSIPEAPIWQATADERGKLTMGPLEIPAASFSRHRVNHFTDLVGKAERLTPDTTKAQKKVDAATGSARRYGAELKRELTEVLATYRADRTSDSVELAKLLPILKELARGGQYYKSFKKDPNSLFAEDDLKNLLPPGSHYQGGRYPTPEEFQRAYDWVKQQVGSGAASANGTIATMMIKGISIIGGGGSGSGGTGSGTGGGKGGKGGH